MLPEWETISVKTICRCGELRSPYDGNLFSNLEEGVAGVVDNDDDVILTVCLPPPRSRSSRGRRTVTRERRICEKRRTIELRRRQREKESKQRKEHGEESLVAVTTEL